MSRLLLIALIILVAGCTAPQDIRLPQLYYVSPEGTDQGVGSAEHPFHTIAFAATLVHPGDKILLKSGVYTEGLDLNLAGFSGQPIHIAASPGERVILTAPNEWVVKVGGSFLILQDLVIRSPRNGLFLTSESHAIIMRNLTIESKNTSILMDGSGNAIINSTLRGGEQGIAITGDRMLVDSTTIEDATTGIVAQGNNAFVRFSTVRNNIQGIEVTGNATRLSHLVITNNRDGVVVRNAQNPWMAHLTVVDNTGTGIYLDPLSVHPIVINSIVSGNGVDIAEQSLTAEVIHTLSLVDPLLSDTFHIQPQSPAIAAGLPLIGEEIDAEGNLHGSEPSLGAFEYIGPKEAELSIREVRVIPSADTVTISWQTNKPASTRVEFGNTTQYNNASFQEGDDVVHRVVIEGLSPERTYFFRILSSIRTELAEVHTNATTLQGKTSYYVSPDGTGQGNGSQTNPWNLQTFLSHPTGLDAGSHVILGPGTYQGCFYSILHGEPDLPIVIEPESGNRPIIQPSRNCSTAILTIGGSWITLRGVEFTDPHTNRTANETNSTPGLPKGIVVQNLLSGIWLEELYMHDLAGSALVVEQNAKNVSLVGSIITTIGLSVQDEAVLLESPATVQDTIIASTSARGLVAEQGGVFEGNVVFGSGDFVRTIADTNYDITTDDQEQKIIFSHNVGFQSNGVNLVLGRGGCVGTMSWNYFNGGDISVQCTLNGGGNTFVNSFVSGTSGDTEPIPVWIRPHTHSNTRTTVVATGNAFHLNLSTLGFRSGDGYTLHNVQNVDNDIQSGTWNGIPILVNMTSHTIRSPVRGTNPTSSFPAFGVFQLQRH